MHIRNYVFISYAGDDKSIADYLSDSINKQLGDSFFSQLVENREEGDTTFTEKVINYFRICNIFIVILTKESINNQFVNQEWGYAKALKELGQIQVIKHITERYINSNDIDEEIRCQYDEFSRIKSRGFISQNMEFVDLRIEKGRIRLEDMAKDVIFFLREKQPLLRPILTEIQQKLIRFNNENDLNITIIDDLINSKEALLSRGSLNPNQFSYDYALQIISIGHLLDQNFIANVENYIKVGKELNVWKNIQVEWVISRGGFNKGNTKRYFSVLEETQQICRNMKKDLEKMFKTFQI